MLGKQAPTFEAVAYVGGTVGKIKLEDYRGSWVVLIFYPEDFSYICPTELEGFAEDYEKFAALKTEIIAVSTDGVYVHRAWINETPELVKVRYPLVADKKGEIAASYGVLNENTGNAMRGLFLIDPSGTIRYMTVTDDSVGRSIKETYRVVAALQTGRLCAADWAPGDEPITEDFKPVKGDTILVPPH